MDAESEQIKEIYARYGLAMYFAQCLERGIAITLATVYGPGPSRITKHELDALLESHFEATLGKLLTRLRQHVAVSDTLDAKLRTALDRRNWLAHHYFWERSGHFMTENGRSKMLAELDEAKELFSAIDSEFETITTSWCEAHGITQEMVDRWLKEITKESEDDTKA